jgi:hypothetical protein
MANLKVEHLWCKSFSSPHYTCPSFNSICFYIVPKYVAHHLESECSHLQQKPPNFSFSLFPIGFLVYFFKLIKHKRKHCIAPKSSCGIYFFFLSFNILFIMICRNPSLGLVTNAKACKGVSQKKAWESHFMLLGVQKSVKDWTPHSQMSSHFGSWTPNGLPNFQRAISGVKIHWIEKFLISLKSSWNIDLKMGSNDPFEYFKPKSWPKEWLGVKLPIWFPTIKNKNRPDFLACKWHNTYC